MVFASVNEEGRSFDGLSYPDYLDYSRESSAVSGLALHFPLSMQLRVMDPGTGSTLGESPRVWGSITSTNYFETLGVRPARGRTFASLDQEDASARETVVVLGHALWQRHFGGDPGVIGREIQLSGHPFTVIGVAPEGFRGAHALMSSDLFVPLSAASLLSPASREILEDRKRRTIWAVGRLAPGVTLEQARLRFTEIARQLAEEYPESNEDIGVTIHPESYSRMGMGSGPVLRLASFVMLVSVALGAPDRLCQRRQPGARAGVFAAQGDQYPSGDGRQPSQGGPTAAHRKPGVGRRSEAPPAWGSPYSRCVCSACR